MTHVYSDVGDYSHPAKGVIHEVPPKMRRAAILLICGRAENLEDAKLLFEALGLDPVKEYSVHIPER